MIGFDPIILGSLAILAASGADAKYCKQDQPTRIDIIPISKSIQYDYNMGLLELQDATGEVKKKSKDKGWGFTQGFMNQSILMSAKIEMAQQIGFIKGRREKAKGCVWYKKIIVEIELDPKIYIAREVKRDRCMFPVVLEHEKEHVRIDQRIVNKYAKKMGEVVQDFVDRNGTVSEVLPEKDLEAKSEKMKKAIFDLVNHYHKELGKERTQKQSAFDSPEEYKRVSNLCPDFVRKKLRKSLKKKLQDKYNED